MSTASVLCRPMVRALLLFVALLLGGDALASQLVAGDQIRVYYNSAGLWNDYDTSNGIQIKDGASWRDVTWPGSPWSQVTIEYTYGGSNYNWSGNASSWPWSVPVEADTSAGSTRESVYEWTMTGLDITKTETWQVSDRYMVVHFEIANNTGTDVTNFRLMHAIDPDQDYDGYFDFSTLNDVRADGLLATSAGASSGLAVGYGICDGDREEVGHTSDWSTDADAFFSDYNGSSGDYAMHWRHVETVIPASTTIDVAFLFIYDDDVSGVNTIFDSVVGTGVCTSCADADGDGHRDVACGGDDCNDSDPTVYPGAPEDCDGKDNDCDGTTDEGCCGDADGDGFDDASCGGDDCDDGNADVFPGATELCDGLDNDCNGVADEGLAFYAWYYDFDGDTFGDPSDVEYACAPPPGFVGDDGDCDDTDVAINPDAVEICNGYDDDCDGLVDDEDPSIDPSAGGLYFFDADLDGYGDPGLPSKTCEPTPGYVENDGDCDDSDPAINPDAIEVCDGGIDNDCNGLADDSDPDLDPASELSWYADSDVDGFGDPAIVWSSCEPPAGYIGDDQDCDDSNPAIHPDAIEICNELDDNCDGLVDDADPSVDLSTGSSFYADADGDGFGDLSAPTEACEAPSGTVEDDADCDDSDPAIHPDATEVCNGYDDDCDAQVDDEDPSLDGSSTSPWYSDGDGDGFGNPGVFINACEPDSGYVARGDDCVDTNPAIHPDATEVCNGFDDDCDTLVDDADDSVDAGSFSPWHPDLDGDGFGDALSSTEACDPPADHLADASDCDDGDPLVHPDGIEVCNGDDDDCDALVDDADPDVDTSGGLPVFADADADGFGDPDVSLLACDAVSGFVPDDSDCDDSDPAIHPDGTEVCNGVDDDCDEAIDDADADLDPTSVSTWHVDADADGFGDPATPLGACDPGSGYVLDATDCDDTEPSTFPGATEICDGLDNNCNAAVDEGIAYIEWYADDDLDGYGDPTDLVSDCAPPSGYVEVEGDCDDGDALINPDATELCNELDDDCDGLVDEDGGVPWYADVDLDGYGDPEAEVIACDAPTGFVADMSDCDDSLDDVYPGADEYCDEIDNDCDELVDEDDAVDALPWYADADGDGYGDPAVWVEACEPDSGLVETDTDCDDVDPDSHPGAPEVPYDGIDQDCDGFDLIDVDGDGYVGHLAGGTDCDDNDPDTYPGAPEVVDGRDNDCNGVVDDGSEAGDDDGDGFSELGGE